MFLTCQIKLPTTQFSAGILSFLNIFSYLTFSARLWITNDSILYRYFTILWYYPAYIQRVEYVFVQRLHFFRAQQLSSLREFWFFANLYIRNLTVVTPCTQPLPSLLSFSFAFIRDDLVSVLSLWYCTIHGFRFWGRSPLGLKWISTQLFAGWRIHIVFFSIHSCLNRLDTNYWWVWNLTEKNSLVHSLFIRFS